MHPHDMADLFIVEAAVALGLILVFIYYALFGGDDGSNDRPKGD